MPKLVKAYEMLKCDHCGELKDLGRPVNTICGDCRVDSCHSVLICGRCDEREVEDENDDCPECTAGRHEAASDAARDFEIEQIASVRRGNR